MAKRQKQQARDTTQGNEELPLCAALLICERVLVEQDQVLSAIRIVDQVAVPANVLANANQLIELPSLQAVGMLKQGNARGMRKVLLSAVSPTGDRAPMGMAMVEFIDAPPDRGGNLVAPMQVIMAGEGVYWLELSIDDAVVARTPLRLKRKTES